MHDSTPLLDRLRHALRDDAPLSPEVLEAAAQVLVRDPDELLLAAALVLEDDALSDAYARALAADQPDAATRFRDLGPLQRALLVRADDEAVEAALDAALEDAEQAPPAVRALALARVAWSHRRLPALLAHPDGSTRRAAAAVLAAAEDLAPVVTRLMALEDEDAWLELLEAIAPLAEEYDGVEAMIDEAALDLPAALPLQAGAAPRWFARAVLAGEVDAEVLAADAHAVATVLWSLPAAPSWTAAAATVAAWGSQEDPEIRTLVGALALVAGEADAQAAERIGADEVQAQAVLGVLLRLAAPALDDKARDVLAVQQGAALGFSLALALADEGQESLLIEAAVHETLCALGLPSPGIPGLPLSAYHEESLDDELLAQARRQLLPDALPPQLEPEERLAQVRTLLDLRRWTQRVPSRFASLAEEAAALWAGHSDPLLQEAARRLHAHAEPTDALMRRAQGNDLQALDALRQLADRGDEASLATLARLLGQLPWPRCLLVEALLVEALIAP